MINFNASVVIILLFFETFFDRKSMIKTYINYLQTAILFLE